jgi:predicted enzyme related to lactoylglutathione lyase
MKFLLILLACCIATQSNQQVLQNTMQLKAWGVKINVTNMPVAIGFYHGVLNFEVARISADSNTVFLKPASGAGNILLHKVQYLLPAGDEEAKASLTLQINNIDTAIAVLKQKGVDFSNYQVRKEGVGYAIYFNDPFGTRISMMQETVGDNMRFTEPRIYNYGFYITDMDVAQKFYTLQLGFVIRSTKYLPLDLPLGHPDGSFAFMLHTRNGLRALRYNMADNEHIVVIFETPGAEALLQHLHENKVALAKNEIEDAGAGKIISFYDPFGYISQAIEFKR